MAATEEELYAPFERYLNSEFYHLRKPKYGSLLLVSETIAEQGVEGGGIWSRPDIAAVAIWRHKYAPVPNVDVLSFEIKPAARANVPAVHQALAHARFANYSYLVWNRSAVDTSDARYRLIAESCRLHGIGLILVHNPSDLRTYVVALDAERKSLDPSAIDEFVELRFSARSQAKVKEGLRKMLAGES
jgi:hypothetical protein